MFNDINPLAVKCAKQNFKGFRPSRIYKDKSKKVKGNRRRGVKFKSSVGDIKNIAERRVGRLKKVDLMLCNPPYIPRPKSIDDNPYEGLSLLHYLTTHGDKILNDGGLFVTNYSSVCEIPFMKMLEAQRQKEDELGFRWEYETKKIGKRTVPTPLFEFHAPFKVMAVLNNPEWMKYINKISRRFDYYPGYGYSHDLHIVALKLRLL